MVSRWFMTVFVMVGVCPLMDVVSRGAQIGSETDPNPIRPDSFGFRNKNVHFGSD
jgi:hypothetical protein